MPSTFRRPEHGDQALSLPLNVLFTLATAAGLQSADTADYCQQEVDYRIVASLDEPTGVLSGRATIDYTNRSPDTLSEFFLHQYLNAFRPGSRWADRDSIAGNRRFNDLEDPHYAFERLKRASIDGQDVVPEYPYAPDSTIVRFALPRSLPPGGTVSLDVEWDARPSTVPRRQGRRGRRFDFAQWYPRVVVYDHGGWQDHPLYPAGEFYGEFATYDVALDVAEDQVIGATGIALEGDPGWEAANAGNRSVDYQRGWYGRVPVATDGAVASSGCATMAVGSGRKCERLGEGRMPIEVGTQQGREGRPVVYARADGAGPVSTVTFETDQAPGRLMLDPLIRSHDWNFTNNRERRRFVPAGVRWRFDTFFSEPSERDRSVVSIAPIAWWHDASDAVVGLRWRSNYMGRFNRWTIELHRGIGGFEATTQGHEVVDYYLEFANPTWLRAPGWTQAIATWAQEGTVGARIAVAKTSRAAVTTPTARETGASVQWVATEQTNFLDPRLWNNAGTIEANAFTAWNDREGDTRWGYRFDAWGGTVYQNDDATGGGPYAWHPIGRVTSSVQMRQSVAGFTLGVRGFAGGVWQDGDRPVRQRGIPINGADPYQTRRNPLVRAQGAPFVGPDVFYHSPGNANMRGYRPGLDGRWALSLNLELERDIIRRSTGLFRGVGLVGFWDVASVDTVAVPATSTNAFKTIYDGGAGIRAWFHVGDVSFPVRIEFPFYVSTPSFAHDRKGGVDQVEFRWLVSFQPIF